MVKPDGVQRGLVGGIITRFEAKGLRIVAMKMLRVDDEIASRHYAEHVGKPFYESLKSFITSGPVLAMVLEGRDAVQFARNLIGKTNPIDAGPGTIRGDYGMITGRNIIHGSDSPESAEREIGLFFSSSEMMDYRREEECWVYEQG